jgi:hypothetical protein
MRTVLMRWSVHTEGVCLRHKRIVDHPGQARSAARVAMA